MIDDLSRLIWLIIYHQWQLMMLNMSSTYQNHPTPAVCCWHCLDVGLGPKRDLGPGRHLNQGVAERFWSPVPQPRLTFLNHWSIIHHLCVFKLMMWSQLVKQRLSVIFLFVIWYSKKPKVQRGEEEGQKEEGQEEVIRILRGGLSLPLAPVHLCHGTLTSYWEYRFVAALEVFDPVRFRAPHISLFNSYNRNFTGWNESLEKSVGWLVIRELST